MNEENVQFKYDFDEFEALASKDLGSILSGVKNTSFIPNIVLPEQELAELAEGQNLETGLLPVVGSFEEFKDLNVYSPYCIAHVYCKSGTKFVIKSQFSIVEEIVKRVTFSAVFHIRCFSFADKAKTEFIEIISKHDPDNKNNKADKKANKDIILASGLENGFTLKSSFGFIYAKDKSPVPADWKGSVFDEDGKKFCYIRKNYQQRHILRVVQKAGKPDELVFSTFHLKRVPRCWIKQLDLYCGGGSDGTPYEPATQVVLAMEELREELHAAIKKKGKHRLMKNYLDYGCDEEDDAFEDENGEGDQDLVQHLLKYYPINSKNPPKKKKLGFFWKICKDSLQQGII